MWQFEGRQGALQQNAFRSLQQTAFQALRHSVPLKDLLKPFKDDRESIQLAEQRGAPGQGLRKLAQGLLAQTRRPPFALLPTRLIEQRASAHIAFLHWQYIATWRTDVGVWVEILRQDRVPEHLLRDLYEMEPQHIILDMQIGLIHSVGKQTVKYAEKMDQAEAEFMGRLQQGQTRPGSVGMWLHRSAFDEMITDGETT